MTQSTPDFPRDRLGAALVRLVLLGAPRRFRSDFGDSIVGAVAARADDVRRRGGTSAVSRFWARQILDLLKTVVAERIDGLRRRPRPLISTSRTFPEKETLLMDTLLSDIRYSVRALIKQPGFSLIVVITLALGIGANTAIFSILDAVVLRPLPYVEPDRLMLITDEMREYDIARAPLATYEVRNLREQVRQFEMIEASVGPFQAPVTSDDGDPEQVRQMNLTPGFLGMLGVQPLTGRTFVEQDSEPLDPAVFSDPDAVIPATVVLLDYAFWQRRYGGDPDVVGTELTIGGRRATVIGVMPQAFRMFVLPMIGGPGANLPVDLYGPVQVDFTQPTGPGFLQVVGRLGPGATPQQGNEEIMAISSQLREDHDRNRRGRIHTTAVPWGEDVSRDVRPALLALLGAVGFVLLIACANVANLLLARATQRRQEIAVRAALGARKGRIIRQVLTESFLLAGTGGLLGLLVAGWGVQAMLTLQPGGMPRADTVGISTGVLLFTVLATVLAVVLFSAAPALALSSVRGNLVLNERGTGGGSVGKTRLRAGLVVAEVALSLVLLIGAGLMLRSFDHLTSADPGFRPDNLLTFQLQTPGAEYRDPLVREAFLKQAVQNTTALPGVESVSVTTGLPLSGALFAGSFFTETMSAEEPGVEANYRGVMPGYFDTMGTPLLQGRDFDPLSESNELVLVDQQLAEHTFPGESPLGKRITLRMPGLAGGPVTFVEVEIIGVVANVRDDAGMAELGRRTVYLPHRFLAFGGGSFAVRTTQDAAQVFPQIRQVISDLDPSLPLFAVRSMQSYIDDAVAPVRFTMVLIGLFGTFALVLAAIGLYGVLANSVRQQTRDLGVRLAFGATSAQILKQVVGRGAGLAALGVVIGLAIAIPLTRALRSLFIGVEPTDPLTLVGISALLLGVSVLACYLPARRAAALDPASSLRSD
ncbi:MAG: FtsX-like permease family protein [Acidobacteria bacterium]|nr:FtsX-like permease family protein [Acidobacteriota bacterium]